MVAGVDRPLYSGVLLDFERALPRLIQSLRFHFFACSRGKVAGRLSCRRLLAEAGVLGSTWRRGTGRRGYSCHWWPAATGKGRVNPRAARAARGSSAPVAGVGAGGAGGGASGAGSVIAVRAAFQGPRPVARSLARQRDPERQARGGPERKRARRRTPAGGGHRRHGDVLRERSAPLAHARRQRIRRRVDGDGWRVRCSKGADARDDLGGRECPVCGPRWAICRHHWLDRSNQGGRVARRRLQGAKKTPDRNRRARPCWSGWPTSLYSSVSVRLAISGCRRGCGYWAKWASQLDGERRERLLQGMARAQRTGGSERVGLA